MKLINWFGLGAFIIGAFVTLGHRFGFLHYHIAFLVFVVALIACTLIMLIGLVMLGLLIARKRPIQAELIPIILACAMFPVMSFYAVGMSAFKAPMIHDITTDTNNPPVFKYIQDDGYRVNSLIYPGAEVSALKKLPTRRSKPLSLSMRREGFTNSQFLLAVYWVGKLLLKIQIVCALRLLPKPLYSVLSMISRLG